MQSVKSRAKVTDAFVGELTAAQKGKKGKGKGRPNHCKIPMAKPTVENGPNR